MTPWQILLDWAARDVIYFFDVKFSPSGKWRLLLTTIDGESYRLSFDSDHELAVKLKELAQVIDAEVRR